MSSIEEQLEKAKKINEERMREAGFIMIRSVDECIKLASNLFNTIPWIVIVDTRVNVITSVLARNESDAQLAAWRKYIDLTLENGEPTIEQLNDTCHVIGRGWVIDDEI